MSIHQQTQSHLYQLQEILQDLALWESLPPNEQALQSTEPFAIDTLAPEQWLQWIFIPRMHALIDRGSSLPTQIAVSAYIEEAMKELDGLARLLAPLIEIEKLLQNQ